jgi:EAL domain-containing protein (putative c-di-GMP-specific phosphodiesterase class I)
MCFEITEDTAVKHMRQTTDLANKLTSLGFHFAVEHFGISSDSRHVINLVPMHYLKIDGSLMQGLNKDSDMQNKIKTLVIEARQKNIHTIAERVEDANTMAILWQLGVSFIQGYYVQSREIVIESVGTQTL